MIYIENKKTYKGEGTYIGRPSKFGNPFPMENESMRAEVIRKYLLHFNDRLLVDESFRTGVQELVNTAKISDLHLICWCSPLPCHGDVIKKYIEDFCQGRVDVFNRLRWRD